MAKTVYARAAGGNWNTNATWSTSSGGAADTTYPVATDTAILDANSGQVTINVNSACAVLSMFAGGAGEYTNTLTFNATLTITGGIDLGGTVAGTGGNLNVTAGCTLTAHGHTFPTTVWFGGTNQTYTFADAWDIGINLQTDGMSTSGVITMNGEITIRNR